jgi:hypothetical protein
MPHVNGVDDGVAYGVRGYSDRNTGVRGISNSGYGMYSYSDRGVGLYAATKSSNFGVWAESNGGVGVLSYCYGGYGIVSGSGSGTAVYGRSGTGIGVDGLSQNNIGVRGWSDNVIGVDGFSYNYTGVRGWSNIGIGVHGYSDSSYGVYGISNSGTGVYGWSATGYAAYLDGNVRITGNLQKGGGRFRIDHPLDPANKYLSHSFVESPDMKNVYDGVVVLDDKGEAVIDLPDWFAALNKDFRYQLTAIGAPGPNLYIAQEIIFSDMTATTTTSYSDSIGNNNNNSSSFKIAGGTSGMKVSWQLTGIRKDPWANANRIEVEEDKPTKERGYYLHPDVYGQPVENGISHLLFPSQEEKWQEEQQIITK